MKLKNATQLAIVGVILQLIPPIIYLFLRLGLLPYEWYMGGFMEYINLIDIIGIILLLPFFITLFKNQK
jgi:hypothetical protein